MAKLARIIATKEQLHSIGIPLDEKLQYGDIVEVKKASKGEAPKHPLYSNFYEINQGCGNYFYTLPVEFLKIF